MARTPAYWARQLEILAQKWRASFPPSGTEAHFASRQRAITQNEDTFAAGARKRRRACELRLARALHLSSRQNTPAEQPTEDRIMHNIDRTLSEFEPEYEAFEYDELETTDGELDSEMVLDETEEMELASELLSVNSEAELDQFLGKLIKKASSAVRKAIRSPVGRALGGFLKGAVKKVLPIAGGALGTFVGGPAGAAIGSQLASGAGSALGLELEGLSPEDQEFEMAKQVVRLSAEAVKNAAEAPQNVDPVGAARAATVAAAKKYAPGLIRPNGASSQAAASGMRSGRWVRQGRKIVLFGV